MVKNHLSEDKNFEEQIWTPRPNPDFYQIVDGKKFYPHKEKDVQEKI